MCSLLLSLLIIFFTLLFLFFYNRFQFVFKNQNGPKPVCILDHWFKLVFGKENTFEAITELYDYNKKNGGLGRMYFLFNPHIFIADKELLKIVTIKEFDHFTDHSFLTSENENNISSLNLFGLKGQRWRNLRATLSPAFTTNKLRIVFPLIDKCSRQVVDFLIEETRNNNCRSDGIIKMEMKNLFTRFTNDAIASAAFGIEVDSLKNPENEFYLMGKELSNLSNFSSSIQLIKSLIYQVSQKLFDFLWPEGFFSCSALHFLSDIVQETINQRRMKGIVRHDMIHLLLEASNKSKTHKEQLAKEADVAPGEIIELNDKDIIGQCIQFFLAGFETVAATLSLTVIQLAEYPEVQTKLLNEFDSHPTEQIDYEYIRDLKYLDMVLSESLRRHPPVAHIDRKCTKRFTFPATKSYSSFTIEPGDALILPYYGFHRDPEYFPDPEKFIPERFSEENKQSIDPITYMPFGLGPRMCIANRFAKMECKILLYHLLKNFEIVAVEETSIPLQLTCKSLEVKPDNGFIVGLKIRQNLMT